MAESFAFRSSSKTASSFTVAVASSFYDCMRNGQVPAYLAPFKTLTEGALSNFGWTNAPQSLFGIY
jgi:hypothetical protein